MGIYDRDYYRDAPRRGGFGSFSFGSVTTWLIVINVSVFLIDGFLYSQMIRSQYGDEALRVPVQFRAQFGIPDRGPLESFGYFSKAKAIDQLQVWRFFTFQFLHASLGHLFANMLSLYLFGPIVENYFGRARFLAFYLITGCSGAVTYLLLLLTGVLHGNDAALVGASAGIFGVLVAGAMLAPDATIMLLFPPIPLQLKYLALILVGWAAYTAFTNGSNAGGQAAHLGGAVVGYALMRYPQVLNVFERLGGGNRRLRAGGRGPSKWSDDFNR